MIALIPSYQPTEKLIQLVKELKEVDTKIIVVDDGSGEEYQQIFDATRAYATVLGYPENHGKGYALKYALKYIQENQLSGAIVTMDSDGQHTVEDALRIDECVREHEKSDPNWLVLGVRSVGKEMPLRSRIGNSITKFVYRLVSGCTVSDTQTGLRGFSAELIPLMLSIPGERYEYEMNVLTECPKSGVQFSEISIATIYEDNNKGSHFRTVRDSFRIYKDLLMFSASSFISFLVDYALYSLLILVTGGLGEAVSIPIANCGARVISSAVNYTLNKCVVFKNKDSVWKTGIQYFVLAICILVGNTIVVWTLVNVLHMNKFIAKLITEVIFFIISWVVQRFIIFRKKEKQKNN